MSRTPRYYALHNMTDRNMTSAITEEDTIVACSNPSCPLPRAHGGPCAPGDERITAWDCIVRHPFFKSAFEKDGALIDSMIELLDKAVSLPSKGENMTETIFTNVDMDGDSLDISATTTNYEKRQGAVVHVFTSHTHGAYLTLKDVAALHKALGDHLEANKRELPRQGAVRFSGGQIAVYSEASSDVEPTFMVHNDGNAGWYAERELEKNFGTDWEELVVK